MKWRLILPLIRFTLFSKDCLKCLATVCTGGSWSVWERTDNISVFVLAVIKKCWSRWFFLNMFVIVMYLRSIDHFIPFCKQTLIMLFCDIASFGQLRLPCSLIKTAILTQVTSALTCSILLRFACLSCKHPRILTVILLLRLKSILWNWLVGILFVRYFKYWTIFSNLFSCLEAILSSFWLCFWKWCVARIYLRWIWNMQFAVWLKMLFFETAFFGSLAIFAP